jgi:glucokinase
MIIDPTMPRHTSGSPGCFEQLASAYATGRLAMELIDAGRPSALAAVYKAQGELTAREVFDAAKAGDDLAEHVVDRVVHYLGMACVNLCRLFDPQMIVFAGGMILAGQYLFDRVIAAYHELNWTILPSRVRIEPAQLGNDAGVIGAAAVAWEAHQAGRVG